MIKPELPIRIHVVECSPTGEYVAVGAEGTNAFLLFGEWYGSPAFCDVGYAVREWRRRRPWRQVPP